MIILTSNKKSFHFAPLQLVGTVITSAICSPSPFEYKPEILDASVDVISQLLYL
jgi:hypothetical protein